MDLLSVLFAAAAVATAQPVCLGEACLGMHREDFVDRHDRAYRDNDLRCSHTDPKVAKTYEVQLGKDIKVCVFRSGIATIADAPTQVYEFWFHRDILYRMYAVVGHQYFSGLRLAILDKFGEPADRAVTTVSNSMGTEFVAARHRWTVGTQVLRLDDYSPNLTQTTLTVYDETRLREAEAAVTPRR